MITRVLAPGLVAACAAPPSPGPSPADSDTDIPHEDCTAPRWVGAWAASPSDVTEPLGGQTLRLVLTPLRDGDTVRVRLSHRFGTEPVELGAVHLGTIDTGAHLLPETIQALTFDDVPAITLAPGEVRTSDPIAHTVLAGEPLAVSVHLPGAPVALTRHSLAMQTSFSAPGAAGPSASGDPFTETRTDRPLVMGLDVLAPGHHGVLAAIGDSLTDGDQAGSGGVDADTRYPDALARRLQALDHPLSPINLGIAGNRVLADPLLPRFGPALRDRLDADLLARADVTDVLLFEGINDLGIPPTATADEVLDGLAAVVDRIHAVPGRLPPRVVLGTLTPAGAATGLYVGHALAEPERQRVNEALRRGAIGDAVVDFDAAVRDPDDPTRIAPAYDAGDGLHLSANGYAALADAVDIPSLRGWRCAD